MNVQSSILNLRNKNSHSIDVPTKISLDFNYNVFKYIQGRVYLLPCKVKTMAESVGQSGGCHFIKPWTMEGATGFSQTR